MRDVEGFARKENRSADASEKCEALTTVCSKEEVWIGDTFVIERYVGGIQLVELPKFNLSSFEVVARYSQERFGAMVRAFHKKHGHWPGEMSRDVDAVIAALRVVLPSMRLFNKARAGAPSPPGILSGGHTRSYSEIVLRDPRDGGDRRGRIERARIGREARILLKTSSATCRWNTDQFVRRCAKVGCALYPLYAPAD